MSGRRSSPPLFLKQIIERRFRPRKLRSVLRHIRASLGLEVIAEIRLVLFPHLFRCRLLAMLRIRRVVLNTHLADMQLRIACLADVESAERQTEFGERGAAAPADEGVGHSCLTRYLPISANYAYSRPQ